MKSSFPKARLEAFSDGVIAILITIMVLEMKVPHHGVELADLKPILPVFLSYLLSFIYVGIYWNNHHHMLHATPSISGPVLWANLHLLFWLSLIPFVTGWMGENHFEPVPTALYGGVLLFAGFAYTLLQLAIIRLHGPDCLLARAVGKDWKGKTSIAFYAIAIGVSFLSPITAGIIYTLIALLWLFPDPRIERLYAHQPHDHTHSENQTPPNH